MITDLNSYDQLQEVISSRDDVKSFLATFSDIDHFSFSKICDSALRDLLEEHGKLNKDKIEEAIEVCVNSKTLYDFEREFEDGIDKIRACTKRISKYSKAIKENIERTNFLTMNSYIMLKDSPPKVRAEIVGLDEHEYDKRELLCACFLLTLNIIDGSKSFDYLFNDKISTIASNIYIFIYAN